MSVVAGGLAGLATWLLVAPRRGEERVRRERHLSATPFVVVGAVVAVLVVGQVLGGRAGAVSATVAVVAAGVGTVARGAWRGRRRDRLADDIARACSALAQELSVGRVPATALSTAARDFAVLRPAASAAAVGGDVAVVWGEAARTPGGEGLGRLARAWTLAETTGAPLAETLDSVAERLRADREVAAVVAAELATARLTGRLLSALPLAGLAVGYGIGGDPVAFLLGTFFGHACLVGGAALAMVGLWWTERMGR
ncbi:type II secretion system F family protein [Mariniluteicoccus endophyticus]